MSSVRRILLDEIRSSDGGNLPLMIKRCINEGEFNNRYDNNIYKGITSAEDLKFYSDKTKEFINNFNLSQITSLLHTFSIPIYRNFQLFTLLTSKLQELLKKSNPTLEECIKIINSCGRLHYSSTDLINSLIEHIKISIGNINTKNQVLLLHNLTKLRFNDVEFLQILIFNISLDLKQLSNVSFTNFIIATSKVYNLNSKLNNHHEILSHYLQELNHRLKSIDNLDLLRHTIALSNLKEL